MPKKCFYCGNELSLRNSFVINKKPACGDCLDKIDQKELKKRMENIQIEAFEGIDKKEELGIKPWEVVEPEENSAYIIIKEVANDKKQIEIPKSVLGTLCFDLMKIYRKYERDLEGGNRKNWLTKIWKSDKYRCGLMWGEPYVEGSEDVKPIGYYYSTQQSIANQDNIIMGGLRLMRGQEEYPQIELPKSDALTLSGILSEIYERYEKESGREEGEAT